MATESKKAGKIKTQITSCGYMNFAEGNLSEGVKPEPDARCRMMLMIFKELAEVPFEHLCGFIKHPH